MPLIHSLSDPSVISPPINVIEATAKNVANCSIERLLNGDRPPPPAPTPLTNSYQEPSLSSGFHPFPCYPASAAAAATIEALGEKTGNTAFWMAREQNRMAMDALRVFNPRPASSVHALCNVEEPADEPTGFKFGPAAHEKEKDWASLWSRPHLPDSPLLRPMQAVPEPVSSPNPDQPLSDLPQAFGSPVSLGGEVEACSRRTHLEISDIVDTRQPSAGEGKKRKSEAISETNDEQEQWAAKAAKALSPAPSEEEHTGLSKQQAGVSEEQVIEMSEGLATPPAQDNETAPAAVDAPAVPERTVKRARVMRVAERLGYAALGGVTAGAMIVGTLIYTAPTFG